jgi:predicted nucleotide-binding protein
MAPPIDQDLLAAISKKSGLSRSAVYSAVAKEARRLSVANEIAALEVASSLGINFVSYATGDQLAQLREARRGFSAGNSFVTVLPEKPRRSKPSAKARQRKPPARKSRKRVWIVHGRDSQLRKSMFDFVQSIGLEPLEFSAALKATGEAAPYVGRILEKAFAMAVAVIVLITPDDVAKLKSKFWGKTEKPYEKKLMGQARPNVLFEAGMAFGTHSRHTVLVEIGECRPFTDILGRHTVRIDNSKERRQELIDRLEGADCEVDLTTDAWLKAGDFAPAKSRRKIRRR